MEFLFSHQPLYDDPKVAASIAYLGVITTVKEPYSIRKRDLLKRKRDLL
jgi:hypothetical protein